MPSGSGNSSNLKIRAIHLERVKYEKNMESRGGDLRKGGCLSRCAPVAGNLPVLRKSQQAGHLPGMPQSRGPAGHPGAPVYAVRQAGPFSGTGILPGLHGGPPFFRSGRKSLASQKTSALVCLSVQVSQSAKIFPFLCRRNEQRIRAADCQVEATGIT